MTEFKERWERMTVVERIAHIRADWANCRETDNPMVLFIASAVAHDVCRQAADEIERLREQLRLANIDNFNITAEAERLQEERDEARRLYCGHAMRDGRVYQVGNDTVWCRTPQEVAGKMGWDCFKDAVK